jgi:hypothetical protein
MNGKPPAAECQHLGHERQILQFTALVEGGEDFFCAAYLDEIPDL